jgi:HEAT repeat protein
VRRAAARVLGRVGRDAAPAVKELLAALRCDEFELRCEAVRTLGQVRAEPDTVVPALLDVLKDPAVVPRIEVVLALAAFAAEAKPAVPALVELAGHATDGQLRLAAVQALGAVGEGAKAAVPALGVILKDRAASTDLRTTAAVSLTRLGPSAKDAFPAMLEVLKDEKTPKELTRALGGMLADGFNGEGVLVLVQAAKEGTRAARVAAMQAIGSSGATRKVPAPLPKEVFDVLGEIAAKDPDEAVRAQATRTLQRIAGRQEKKP